VFAACVLAVSFDKVRTFDLDVGSSQGQIKAVREQLMGEDTKDVEPLVDFVHLSQQNAQNFPVFYISAIDVKNINLQIKNIKKHVFHFYKKQ